MPKYKCKITRDTTHYATIEVEADNAEDAAFIAETTEGRNHDGPWEKEYEDYSCWVRECEEITSEVTSFA